LRVVEFRVKHFGGKAGGYLGEMGVTSSSTQYDDDVQLSIKLSEPANFYLIALNPDGKEQLSLPRKSAEQPVPLTEASYPPGKESAYGLTDGVGVQAFVLVASRAPLPSWDDWKRQHGAPPWQGFVADGVWRCDGREFEALPKVRGVERRRRGLTLSPTTEAVALLGTTTEGGLASFPWAVLYGGPPKPLIDLAGHFREQPLVEVFQMIAFPVRERR
jgi:hypothetical protein